MSNLMPDSTKMCRKHHLPMVAGNWKMNGSKELVKKMSTHLQTTISGDILKCVEVVIAPPFPYLSLWNCLISDAPGIDLAAQNIGEHKEGAFTGEVSASMLVDLQIPLVIVGHSERRRLYGETDKIVRKKLQQALAVGMRVILCVGEAEDVRDQGESNAINHVFQQLSAALLNAHDVNPDDAMLPLRRLLRHVIVAYEPVWAIGTGRVATPQQVSSMHQAIQRWFCQELGTPDEEEGKEDNPITPRILYGGSVTSSNCGALAELAEVDGFLVGGASLKPVDFGEIILTTAQIKGQAK